MGHLRKRAGEFVEDRRGWTVIGTMTRAAAPMPMEPAAFKSADWRQALPVLRAGAVTLRELRLTDAPSLLEMLTTQEVTKFISPPPTSVEGFERFIAWTHRERGAGRYICFGIVPSGVDQAVGIIQVRTLAPGFDIAEWGFAIGSSFWGTGIFQAAARSSRSSLPTSGSTSWKHAPPSSMAAATARSRNSGPPAKASCAGRSCVTVSSTIR